MVADVARGDGKDNSTSMCLSPIPWRFAVNIKENYHLIVLHV